VPEESEPMKKTRLTLDSLEVQSFATTSDSSTPRGTVHGHDAPTDQVECPTADVNWATCAASCGCGGGNTDDCTVICESDACSAQDCSFTCDWGWTFFASRC
jgi:hypothetical protein